MKRVIVKPYSKDRYELSEIYEFKALDNTFIIPEGYLTDGASIPRILWSFLPPNSPEYLTAAVCHDYLCELAYGSKKALNGFKPSFKEADEVFKKHLKELGVKPYKVFILYYGVRIYHRLRYGD